MVLLDDWSDSSATRAVRRLGATSAGCSVRGASAQREAAQPLSP